MKFINNNTIVIVSLLIIGLACGIILKSENIVTGVIGALAGFIAGENSSRQNIE